MSNTLSNKGQIHITTDNWTDFQNKTLLNSNKNASLNPTSSDFDWKYHAGIINDKDFKKLIKSYHSASQYIEKMYSMTNADVNKFLLNWEKNKKHQKLIQKSFENITLMLKKIQFDKNKTKDEEIKKKCFNVAMCFYMENHKKNIHFTNGEEWLLILCHKIALFTGTNEIETMMFILYKAFLLKCKLKDFFFPIIELDVDGKTYSFYKEKELSRPHFFSFLIVYMFMKIKPNTIANLFKEKSASKNKFFNNFIKNVFDFFMYNLPFKISNIDTLSLDIKQIFGDVLLQKNPLPLFAYIISYLKTYTPDKLKITFPCDKCENKSSTDPENADQLFKKIVESIGFTDKNKKMIETTIIKKSIPTEEYKKINDYLTKNIVKIAKIAKNRLNKKNKGDIKKVNFRFPKIIKKPILQKGGNRKFVKTKKHYKSSKNITFKHYH